MITNKFSYHLPLYRQEQILAHYGVAISRSTLCGWLAQSAELFGPLYNLMIKRVRGSRIIWTDDTTVPVWDPTLPRTRTGRFWVYLGDAGRMHQPYLYPLIDYWRFLRTKPLVPVILGLAPYLERRWRLRHPVR